MNWAASLHYSASWNPFPCRFCSRIEHILLLWGIWSRVCLGCWAAHIWLEAINFLMKPLTNLQLRTGIKACHPSKPKWPPPQICESALSHVNPDCFPKFYDTRSSFWRTTNMTDIVKEICRSHFYGSLLFHINWQKPSNRPTVQASRFQGVEYKSAQIIAFKWTIKLLFVVLSAGCMVVLSQMRRLRSAQISCPWSPGILELLQTCTKPCSTCSSVSNFSWVDMTWELCRYVQLIACSLSRLYTNTKRSQLCCIL